MLFAGYVENQSPPMLQIKQNRQFYGIYSEYRILVLFKNKKNVGIYRFFSDIFFSKLSNLHYFPKKTLKIENARLKSYSTTQFFRGWEICYRASFQAMGPCHSKKMNRCLELGVLL